MKKVLSSIGFVTTIIVILATVAIASGYASLELIPNPAKTSFNEDSKQSAYTISRNTADTLNEAFKDSEKELTACLDLEHKIKTIKDSSVSTHMVIGFEDNIEFHGKDISNAGYCQNGIIHSHPKRSCYFSVQDIISFKDRIDKGEYISVLMCGEDEFYYITRNSFTEKRLDISNTFVSSKNNQ